MRIGFSLLLVVLVTGCFHHHAKTQTPDNSFARIPGLEPQGPTNAAPSTPTANANTTNAKSKNGPIITPEEGLVGKVAKAIDPERFVVLTFPIGHLPKIDQTMNVYRHGLKVGEVKVTGPQQDESIVADITTGVAADGDEVRER